MQWEHKVKEAFHKRDENFSFNNKENLWKRISEKISREKLVPAFWRVAAVMLALLAIGVAIAGISHVRIQNDKLAKSENKNIELQNYVDSLKKSKPQVITEVRVVEKEKVVYQEVEKNINQSADSSELQVTNLQVRIDQLQEELLLTNQQLQITKDSLHYAISTAEEPVLLTNNLSGDSGPVFSLKTEKVKEQMYPVKTEVSPKMKLQLLKIQENNVKYDINSTLLKK